MAEQPYSRRVEVACYLMTMASMGFFAFGLMGTLRAIAEVEYREGLFYWATLAALGGIGFFFSEEWAGVIYAANRRARDGE
jgi:hypothetical protein